METNVVGVLLGLKHVLPVMVAQGSGAVVNSCSVAGLRGGSGLPAYVASKHAVLGLTRSAANEVAGKGVRVVCIAPGAIQGAMLQGHMSQLGSDVAAIQHQLDASVPMGRSGTNEEVARLVTFLASEEASYCTGSAYVIDGGLMA
jgi:NAD(P)-dependent dehydrogenase (short-subunit alcohol dehydrogenase family)